MSGISSGIGLISGIDTQTLINQLLAVEARPKILVQSRKLQLEAVQTAYLDINSRLSALQSAAQAFNTDDIFASALASSSNSDVLTATAQAGAAIGSYQFLVDRTVTTQSMMSRGFADRDTSAIGAGQVIIEGEEGRLDRDTKLSQLNGGTGITRGVIEITDSQGETAAVDLSRVATVGEVLEAINSADGVGVTASVVDGSIILTDTAGGGGSLSLADDAEYPGVVASLGLDNAAVAGVITGDIVYSIGSATKLSTLNDGNGVRFSDVAGESSDDFTITLVDGTTSYGIDIGDIWEMVDGELTKTASAVSDYAGLKARIEDQTGGDITVSTSADGSSIVLTDNTAGGDDLTISDISGAAADLGILKTGSGNSLQGNAVLAGLNSTLISTLNGGSGLTNDDLSITDRNGTVYNFTVSTDGSVSALLAEIEAATGGAVTASLDANGVGITLTDTTGGGSNLIVQGGAAQDLGIETDPAGVASNTVDGDRLQHQYVAESTLLSQLNGGRGVGIGTFTIRDASGAEAEINVTDSVRTVEDLITLINSRSVEVEARINDSGDGIIIEKEAGAGGSLAITIEDTSGSVADGLNLAGQAGGTDDADNFIDGSYERTIDIDADDTLNDLLDKINESGANVNASIINDGSDAAPFRLNLTSTRGGAPGRFTITSGTLDLGLNVTSAGQNARAFFGSEDPARAVLLTSDTNTLDDVIEGVSIDLKSTSDTPVTLSVTQDITAMEQGVQRFIDAFNNVIGRIDQLTDYNEETESRGPLLGDTTSRTLRDELIRVTQEPAFGVSGPFQRLTDIGIKVGTGGTLELDADKLREAIEQDPQAVADLLGAKEEITDSDDQEEIADGIFVKIVDPDKEYSSLGIGEILGQAIERYVDSIDGVLTTRNNSLQDQIDAQQDRIEAIDARLAARRSRLEAQFVAMEQALAQLQTQQSALLSLGG